MRTPPVGVRCLIPRCLVVGSFVAVTFWALALGMGAPGEATLNRDTPGYIEVDCTAPGRQLLVVSENNLEGWHVTVDGAATELLRPYGDFLGCVVPEGEHTVVFRFWPAHFTHGILVTVVALLVTVAWLGLSLYLGLRWEHRRQVAEDG